MTNLLKVKKVNLLNLLFSGKNYFVDIISGTSTWKLIIRGWVGVLNVLITGSATLRSRGRLHFYLRFIIPSVCAVGASVVNNCKWNRLRGQSGIMSRHSVWKILSLIHKHPEKGEMGLVHWNTTHRITIVNCSKLLCPVFFFLGGGAGGVNT
jgi:hypothetical protein